MDALVTQEPPQRVHVVGPSGAGKTSLVLRVIADLARRQLDIAHEVLILRVGDRPERLGSGEEVNDAPTVRGGRPREGGHRPSRHAPYRGSATARRREGPRARGHPRARHGTRGFADDLETIIERAAIDDLQVPYHERDHDLRSVLKLAHAAAAHALGRNATVITARDVRGALSPRGALSS